MTSWLDRLLGNSDRRTLKALEPEIAKINSWEAAFEALSAGELREKTAKFRQHLLAGESLEPLLSQAFATVREASKRTLKLRHFDVQLLGGLVLHQGKIAEMKTGEGKTLVATLPVYLNALSGKGVHIITVNDYLAKRDAEWMRPVYEALGLTVGYITHETSPDERRAAYLMDVTYGTNNEFGFDYLRDNMALSKEQMVQRELHYAIVDEVDSILIDEARTPLIISMPDEESTKLYEQFAEVIARLGPEDAAVDEKLRTVTPTESGISKIEKALGVESIYERGDIVSAHHIEQALKAQLLFKRDKDYVVKDSEVIIVDEFTGRLMHGRRYSEGLHQAIEAKESVPVKQESKTLATITFQNYFRLYQKLAGMTGTAKTEGEEFWKIYGLEVVAVPTNAPMIRQDLNDLVYSAEAAKFQAIAREVKRRATLGQPVLIGTIAIEKSEVLSEMLRVEGVQHEVLNAKHHEKEAVIIAQAGRRGAVTVATNMAGRGVDIILGGTPFDQAKYLEVKRLGGLFVLGSERHESRRIDNQLRGRSGRQGDPGSSQFFVSLEDDLLRIFGSQRLQTLLARFKIPREQPLEHPWITSSIETAQKKVEGHNFDIRKTLLEYDDVMNRHREAIYRQRRALLEQADVGEGIQDYIRDVLIKLIAVHTQGAIALENLKKIAEVLKNLFSLDSNEEQEILKARERGELTKFVLQLAERRYRAREERFGKETMRQVERQVLSRVIDTLWIEHIDAMVKLREGIGLRGFGQRDPLVEYKQEAFEMYERLRNAIAADLVEMIYKVEIVAAPPPTPREVAHEDIPEPETGVAEEKRELAKSIGTQPEGSQRTLPPLPAGASDEEIRAYLRKNKVGRNDPCPCGAVDASGKPIKFKKCHGR